MKPQTYEAIKNLIKMDDSIDKATIEYAMRVFAGREKIPSKPPLPGIIRFKEAVQLLGVESSTLRRYVRAGNFERAYAGHKQAVGITVESYRRFFAQNNERHQKIIQKGTAS